MSVSSPLGPLSSLIVDACSYVGCGNVLKAQEYMQLAAKSSEDQREIDKKSVALIGVALLCISEPVGQATAIRFVHQLLQYCELPLKRVVPIFLVILGIANSNIQISDLLYKLAHDEDEEMSLRALIGLGVIGAGTNNSRLAALLRNLGMYYEDEPAKRFAIKLALGILHAGKGLLSVNPYYSDGFLFSKTNYAAVIILAFAMLNTKELLITNNHYLMFFFALALRPKMLILVDEKLNEIKANVRVGTAIDIVGQVGKPRKITGFQTHVSPVIINNGERAELATEEFVAVAETTLEDFVVLKKNPSYEEGEKAEAASKA